MIPWVKSFRGDLFEEAMMLDAGERARLEIEVEGFLNRFAFGPFPEDGSGFSSRATADEIVKIVIQTCEGRRVAGQDESIPKPWESFAVEKEASVAVGIGVDVRLLRVVDSVAWVRQERGELGLASKSAAALMAHGNPEALKEHCSLLGKDKHFWMPVGFQAKEYVGLENEVYGVDSSVENWFFPWVEFSVSADSEPKNAEEVFLATMRERAVGLFRDEMRKVLVVVREPIQCARMEGSQERWSVWANCVVVAS